MTQTETAYEGEHPLDNAAWAALTTHHASMAEVHGRARRYPPDVSVFTAVDHVDESSWHDLAALAGAHHPVALFRGAIPFVPPNWTELARGEGYQLILEPSRLSDVERLTIRRLTVDDVPRMLDLVALTTPGPFLPRTVEMGRYYGHFDGEELLAMAGERLHLDGFTEISAVCTHPVARGRGLASTLTHTVATAILDRDEQPFLHVAHGNDSALRVYGRLGFTRRRQIEFVLVEPQQDAEAHLRGTPG